MFQSISRDCGSTGPIMRARKLKIDSMSPLPAKVPLRVCNW